MIEEVDNSWREIIKESLNALPKDYIKFLKEDNGYFPSKENFLNAFKTLSLENTRYILFGQDPYPRRESAVGYAFIDGTVKSLWSEHGGLSKEVNRATSLRNFMKMLLYSEGKLTDDFSKDAIKKVDKRGYINSIYELRDNFEREGVLLLNTALIFTDKRDSKYHIKIWRSFIKRLLANLNKNDIELILFGNMAKEIERFDEAKSFTKQLMPHPYNIEFITDQRAVKLFGSMSLLQLQPTYQV
jgi:uracil-DNA glycosylase